MKLKEYIEELQKIYVEHGDIELIYARDDEGNGYDFVRYQPTKSYFHLESQERISEDDITDYAPEDYSLVVCVN